MWFAHGIKRHHQFEISNKYSRCWPSVSNIEQVFEIWNIHLQVKAVLQTIKLKCLIFVRSILPTLKTVIQLLILSSYILLQIDVPRRARQGRDT